MSSQNPVEPRTGYGEGGYGTSSYGGVTRLEPDEGGDGAEDWAVYYSPLREMYGGLTEIQRATNQGP